MKKAAKNIMSLLLVITLVFGVAGVLDSDFENYVLKAEAGGADPYFVEYTEGDYVYTVIGKEAMILRYNNEYTSEVIVPNNLGGYDVTIIAPSAFSSNYSIISLLISEGVKEIRDRAFKDCINLKEISLPKSIESIGRKVFDNTAYTNDYKNWSNELLYIGNYLIGCNDKVGTNVEIKEGTEIIAGGVFSPQPDADSYYEYLNAIKSVTIPGSVRRICSSAFVYSDNLENIEIDNGVRGIEDFAFYGCNFYDNEDNWDDDALYIGTHLIEVKNTANGNFVIKQGTVEIAAKAFEGCEDITSIFIPDSVDTIGSGAFMDCSLKNIIIPDGVTTIERQTFSTFNNKVTLEYVHIPASVNFISGTYYNGFRDYELFGDNSSVVICFDTSSCYAKTYAEENGIKFELCDGHGSTENVYNGFTYVVDENLEVTINDFIGQISGALVIPDMINGYPVTSIGWMAFSYLDMDKVVFNCTHLETIGDGAFTGCASLTEITIPDGVTSIGASGFSYNDNLTTVNIPESVEYIGESCFEYNDNLTSVNWNTATLTEIKESTFEGCASLEEITIPPSVTYIGEYGFAFCENLIVKINDAINLKEIGDYAFTGCANLTEITIPDGVTSIGPNGFSYNDNLTTVNIPESVEYIGESCFEYNDNLTSVNWNTATLTEIKESTFEGCASLEEITIPPSVTYIGDYGFAFCENLVTVINDAINLMGIGDNAFSGCTVLQEITGTEVLYGYIGPGYSAPDAIAPKKVILPYGLETIGSRAFENCVSIKYVSIPATVKTIGESAFDNCTGIEEVNYMGTGLGWNSIDIRFGNSLLQPKSLNFKGSLIYSPSTTTVKYGETLGLHANTDGLPEGAKIEWSAEGDAVSIKPTADGKACGVVSQKSGEAVVKATVVDANGNAVLDANSEEISSTQKITSKAGLWERIVSFFKNLFRINRVIPQSVKMFF